MILYNCCTTEEPNTFTITKFDDDFNVESSYLTTLSGCECPAGVRDTCRHRKMLPIFIATEHIDDNWFYNYDTHGWHKIDQSDPFVDQDHEPIHEMTEPAKAVAEISLVQPKTEEPALRRRI